ncbi:MAG: Lrp/AsnC family transcriptional regulator [Candidatus Altiarchaeota archaeon]|nr:Lrp/AsnC family transcriptional regulator [Candidatus Altiarchaeota archaeon]
MIQKHLKLNKIDLKILFELEDNCRRTNKQISKATRLSEEVVSYRINKLKGMKIIRGFNTLIDYQKLGLNVGTFLIKTRGLNNKAELEFVKYLKNIDYISWIGKTIGRWDFLIAFMYRDIYDLNIAMTKMMNAFSDRISDYQLLFDLDNYYFSGKVLFGNLNKNKTKIRSFLLGENKKAKVDFFDIKLLKLYSSNARLSLLKASKELDCSLNTIKYRLKKLEEKGVIRRYSARVDYSKLNLMWIICFFKLSDFSEDNKRRLISYLKQQEEVTFVVNTVGDYVDCDVQLKSNTELELFLRNVKAAFGDNLTSVDTLTVIQVFKQDFLPINLMMSEYDTK